MSDLMALIEAVENADPPTRDEAMHAAMSVLIARGTGYWDTPEGQRLRPLWEDWSDDGDADVNAGADDIERRILTGDWSGLPTPQPFRCPNGLMSNDPFAFGDPFTGEQLYWTPDEWYRVNHPE